jgi:hypothetical protein
MLSLSKREPLEGRALSVSLSLSKDGPEKNVGTLPAMPVLPFDKLRAGWLRMTWCGSGFGEVAGL